MLFPLFTREPRDFHELPAPSGVLHAGAPKAMRSPAALLLLLCATCCSALVVVPARPVVHAVAVAARENACRTELPKPIIGYDPKP